MAFEWKSEGDDQRVNLRNDDAFMDVVMEVPPTEQLPPPPPQTMNTKVLEVPDDEIIEDIEVPIDMEMSTISEPTPVIVTDAVEEEDTDEVFVIVEEKPQFPGGDQAFLKYVMDHVVYPAQARRMQIEGKVFIKLIVGKDGSVTSAEIMKGIGAGCDEEALRVIKQSPKWKPARQRGRNVKASLVIPVIFKLG